LWVQLGAVIIVFMAQGRAGPGGHEMAAPLSSEELAVAKESAAVLRETARRLRLGEVTLDQALFEDMRATVAYLLVPLLRRAP
jgi:hypothetical protein